MAKKTETMFGGVHWGLDSYYWESNMIATTALAFKVLSREKEYQSYLKQIIQFFLNAATGRADGRNHGGISQHTAQSILPEVLNDNTEFQSAATLQISGNGRHTSGYIPYSLKMDNA